MDPVARELTDGAWSLVTCVVAAGFDFAGFEPAPPGRQPGPDR